MRRTLALFALAGCMLVSACSAVTEKDLTDLQSPNAMVRREAVRRIATCKRLVAPWIGICRGHANEQRAGAMMVNLLRKGEESRDTQLDILAALSKLAEHTSVPVRPLIEKLEDKDPRIRSQAIKAAVKTDGHEASAGLVELLKKQENDYPIIWALGEIGDPSAVPCLNRLLASEDSYVCYNARKALAKIGEGEEDLDSKPSGNSKEKGLLEIGKMAFRSYQHAMMVVFEKITGVKKTWAGT